MAFAELDDKASASGGDAAQGGLLGGLFKKK
jgi:hypothetical protein